MSGEVESELWQLERDFWTGREEHNRLLLASEVAMIFPGMVLDRQGTIEPIAAPPRWREADFDQQRTLALSNDVVALHYRATARREGDAAPYTAHVASVYVRRDDKWRLALHQQTPEAG